jgi:predicted Zn-dependent protease
MEWKVYAQYVRLPTMLGALRALWVAGLIALTFSTPAYGQSISIIRDAEIESMIRQFAAPFLKAAGIVRANPRIYLVADRRFNAFVVEDGSIFINYGTIIESETPNALKAVLAHEIGHLAGGHLARLREQSEIRGRLQAVAMLLGIGAIAASSGGGADNELGEIASAFIIASQSVGQNSLMAYRRSEESAADAAALKLLHKTGQSSKGLVEVLTRLGEDQVARSGASPYLRSHPLAEDRLAQTTRAAKQSQYWGRSDSRKDIAALDLARAKLVGYLETQQSTLNRYPNSDKSLAGRYARIITAYKSGAAVSAVAQMPKLVAAAPSNPFFNELLGQMYYETGNAQKALAPLKKAVKLAPGESEIRRLYGQALLDAGGPKNLTEAVAQLNRVTREDRRSARAFTLLSRAYAGLGQTGQAQLAAAEAALVRGDKGTALGLARQAQKELNKPSPAWLRADDILSLGR